MDRTSPSQVGATAEAAVCAALVRAGMGVYLLAFGGHGRADLVVEDREGLHRVQCKTGRLVGEDSVVFRACSQTGGLQRGYDGEVELFGVHCPPLEAVFLVPVADVGRTCAVLRLTPPRNGQRKGIRWAHDYRLDGHVAGAVPPARPSQRPLGTT